MWITPNDPGDSCTALAMPTKINDKELNKKQM
jgi:hypothetical protein